MHKQILLRVVTKLMVPYIMLFGLYVITHGELGPGGGFQGGVIFAAAFILYGLVYGAAEMRRIVPRSVTDAVAAGGVLLYVSVGVYCLFQGDNFLDYTHLIPGKETAASGESWGMTLVEYGVGMTVAAAMVTIFNEITEGTVPAAKAGQ